MTETILTNARLILDDEIVPGTIVFRDDVIRCVDQGRSALPAAIDAQGDYVAPGIIEMHTDNMEKHFVPRPKVFWPDPLGGALGHDAQMAAAGVTTVYDSICCGSIYGAKDYSRTIFPIMIAAIEQGLATKAFRVDHRIHLRCEVPAEDIVADLEPHLDKPVVKLASLMDHTPGQRQWRNIEHLRTYNLGSGEKTLEQFESDVALRMAQLGDSTFLQKNIIDARRVICASPAYLEARGEPEAPDDLLRHECLLLRFPGSTQFRWTFGSRGKALTVPVSGSMDADDGDVLTDWAVAGLGLVMKPLFEVSRHVAEGRLRIVMPEHPPQPVSVALLYPSRKMQPRRERDLIELTHAAVKKYISDELACLGEKA